MCAFVPRRVLMWLYAVLVLSFSHPALAGPGPSPSPRDPSTPAPSISSQLSGKHRLAAGDEVEIHIVSLPDLERIYRLRSDGGLYHPLAGEVRAAGMTLQDLQATLQKRLARELRNPTVRVGLRSMAKQDVTILGEVARPGKYEVLPGASALDVLAMAGGNTPAADLSTAILMRSGQSQTVDLNPPDPQATEVEQTLMEPGDILYLLPGTQVSVSGDVARPGVYALPRAVCDPFKALEAAGGPKPGAALNRVVLQRASLNAPVLLDLSRPDRALPEAARTLQQGDSLRVPERQVVLLGGVSKAGPMTLEAGDNVLDVIMRAGVSDPKRLNDVTLIRSEDVRAGRQKTEKHDLTPYLKNGDASVLVPVYDGDVVYVPVPSQRSGFNLFNLLFLGRTLFGY